MSRLVQGAAVVLFAAFAAASFLELAVAAPHGAAQTADCSTTICLLALF